MIGSIYIVRCGDFAKIGYSASVESRVKALQAYNPHPVEFIAVFPGTTFVEREVHNMLARYRHRGEWFRWCEKIEKIAKLYPPPTSQPVEAAE